MTGYVVCARPGGCGWFWERHEVRTRWPRRRRFRYYGPYFEDGGGYPRWMDAARLDEMYGDCIRHLAHVSERPR